MSTTTQPNPGTPELTGQPVWKSRLKSVKKQQQERTDTQDGLALAREWLGAKHPSLIEELLEYVGEDSDCTKRKAWKGLPWEHRGLETQIQARGQTYWRAFIAEVRRHWHHTKRVWVAVMYQNGIDDGRRWATEIASPELVARLRQMFDETPQTLLPAFSPYRDKTRGFLTPAHKLVVTLLGDTYPRLPCGDEDFLPEIDADCMEFRDFWQPFIEEPTDRLWVEDAYRTSKLNDPNYISGFLDGASGKSEALARTLLPGSR